MVRGCARLILCSSQAIGQLLLKFSGIVQNALPSFAAIASFALRARKIIVEASRVSVMRTLHGHAAAY